MSGSSFVSKKLESYHESYTFATTVLQQTRSSLHRIWSDFFRLSMVEPRSSPAAPLSPAENLEKACALSIRLGGKVNKAATMCNIDRRTLQRLIRIEQCRGWLASIFICLLRNYRDIESITIVCYNCRRYD